MSDYDCGLGEGTHYACECALRRIAYLERALSGLQCRACGYRIGEERPGPDRCACTEARGVLAGDRASRREGR